MTASSLILMCSKHSLKEAWSLIISTDILLAGWWKWLYSMVIYYNEKYYLLSNDYWKYCNALTDWYSVKVMLSLKTVFCDTVFRSWLLCVAISYDQWYDDLMTIVSVCNGLLICLVAINNAVILCQKVMTMKYEKMANVAVSMYFSI